MQEKTILIVGAGPTGLVLALELARRNTPFRIIDTKNGPGEASRAMVVHARTLEFYQQLGFADELVSLGIHATRFHVRVQGKDAATITLSEMGKGLSPFPFVLCFPQDEHERFLVKKLETLGVSIEWGTTLKALKQEGSLVTVDLERDGTIEHTEFSFVCGADGAHSAVREELGMQLEGGTDDHLFFVADVKIASGFERDIVLNLQPETLELMFPVRSTGMQRLIGVVPTTLQSKGSIVFEDVRARAEALIGVGITDVNWFATYHVHHRVAPYFQVGSCFILGDAAHIHSPVGGQGMNTGIGDAVNLAWKLSLVISGKMPESVLHTYEIERIAFARALVATTDTAFGIIINKRFGTQVIRVWVLPRLLSFLTLFAPLRRQFFKALSQIRINYRMSPLSSGAAGRLQAGDRFPILNDPKSNIFLQEGSLSWGVYVFGELTPALHSTAVEQEIVCHALPWSKEAKELGIVKNAVYVIRPDGYIGFVSATQNVSALEQYTKTNFL